MNQNASYIVETLDIVFMTETLMTIFQKFCNDGCKEGNPECAIHMIFLRSSFPPEVCGRGCQHLPGQESPSLHVRHPAPGDLLHGGGQGPVLDGPGPLVDGASSLSGTGCPTWRCWSWTGWGWMTTILTLVKMPVSPNISPTWWSSTYSHPQEEVD